MLKYANWPRVVARLNPLFSQYRAGKIDVDNYSRQATKIVNENLTQKNANIKLQLDPLAVAPRAPANWL